MSVLKKIENICNKFSDYVGAITAICLILLLFNVFYDVVSRYVFNSPLIGLQELEWHLYSIVFLLGISYCLKEDSHVRVDVVYERLSAKKKAFIDISGTLLFVLPFSYLIVHYGIGFAHEAFKINESSGDPGGLPYRWIIKSFISISFLFVLISSVGFMLKAYHQDWLGEGDDIKKEKAAGDLA